MMLNRIKKFMETWPLLTAGDIVLAGVSGGADSMCLLFVQIGRAHV